MKAIAQSVANPWLSPRALFPTSCFDLIPLYPWLHAIDGQIGLLLPEASHLPSGEKATALTVAAWPLRVINSCLLATSQSFTDPSELPVASLTPSGENESDNTEPAWPLSVVSSRPVSTSHNLTVLSSPPVAKVLLSGENVTDVTPRYRAL